MRFFILWMLLMFPVLSVAETNPQDTEKNTSKKSPYKPSKELQSFLKGHVPQGFSPSGTQHNTHAEDITTTKKTSQSFEKKPFLQKNITQSQERQQPFLDKNHQETKDSKGSVPQRSYDTPPLVEDCAIFLRMISSYHDFLPEEYRQTDTHDIWHSLFEKKPSDIHKNLSSPQRDGGTDMDRYFFMKDSSSSAHGSMAFITLSGPTALPMFNTVLVTRKNVLYQLENVDGAYKKEHFQPITTKDMPEFLAKAWRFHRIEPLFKVRWEHSYAMGHFQSSGTTYFGVNEHDTLQSFVLYDYEITGIDHPINEQNPECGSLYSVKILQPYQASSPVANSENKVMFQVVYKDYLAMGNPEDILHAIKNYNDSEKNIQPLGYKIFQYTYGPQQTFSFSESSSLSMNSQKVFFMQRCSQNRAHHQALTRIPLAHIAKISLGNMGIGASVTKISNSVNTHPQKSLGLYQNVDQKKPDDKA